MPGRILIIGASGALGRPLTAAFVREGFTVRAMARDAARLARSVGDGVEVFAGDARLAEPIASALDGCDGVHVTVAHTADDSVVVDNVVRAAKRTGVRRISYVSGTSIRAENAWFPMVAQKLRAERTIEESGVPFTIFRPTWFMEVVARFCTEGRAVCFGSGKTRFHFVASDDFAQQVPRAYLTAEAENRAFGVLGPEPITLFDAIDRYRARVTPEIAKVTRMPYVVARGIGWLRGSAGAPMRDAIGLVRYFDRATERPRDADAERILGKCKTTFDAWLESQRARTSVAPASPR